MSVLAFKDGQFGAVVESILGQDTVGKELGHADAVADSPW
jgi:hypothetical protein